MVRLHLAENGPTIEGILTGRVAGHYRVIQARVFENEGRSFPLSDDGQAWVPAGRVVFVQVIRS
jgi:hypothetical protein